MEEILASIRRIISEDDSGLGALKSADADNAPARLPSVPVSAADIDALFSARVNEFAPIEPPRAEPARVELPRVELPPAPVAPSQPAVEPRMLRTTLPPLPEPAQAVARVERPAPPAPIKSATDDLPHNAPLLSQAADAAVMSAFGDLSNTVLSANSRTLDDLVKEMLRPMLKNWLDSNLPPLVERLVRDEIERLSRRR
ncbi:hypothetical protein K32_20630 [Kaistia sp. 32K]|uniref:PopZ family protein n=1 Tax=Kaistia sp. 32K TaxID=2795690 RepID=UPI001934FEB2|nr:DUF2497 domain-containing protein [Kaistia sp. 32K]BCP53446.1 hypothetical protein K32_20630 [Kaistia sp. 32K]